MTKPTFSVWAASPTLDWVVVGGESGAGARPMHPEWARQLRDQCSEAGVPFLFKQWGEWAPGRAAYKRSVLFNPAGVRYTPSDVGNPVSGFNAPGMESLVRVGKTAAGRVLDGVTHDEYPEEPRG